MSDIAAGTLDGEPAPDAARPVTVASRRDRLSTLEAAILVGLLVLAAFTRLPGLDARGQWDADQGTDMLVLQGLVEHGELPLLGPLTSTGSFHHGALYYWLLAPSAFLSGADPVAVTFELALLGIGAVAATWWLARLLGGRIAAAVAGLLMAVSPAGIGESTFIWNPNPIPLFAALAFAGTIKARRTGRARWWLLAGTGAMATMQLHVLGAVILVPLAWAWAADVVARRRGPGTTTNRASATANGAGDATRNATGARGTVLGGLGAALIVLAGFLPLLASELGHGFAESRAIVGYLTGGGREAAGGALERVITIALRSLTWPFAGVITDRVLVSLITAIVVSVLIALAVIRVRTTHADERRSRAVATSETRWLAGSLAVSVVLLAFLAPSLATVTPGLPNDHYHNLLDPLVIALSAAGLARLGALRLTGRAVAEALAVALVAIAATAWPPSVSDDGGWPLADQAAARVLQTTGDAPLTLDGIPPFKNANAIRFPLERRGVTPLDASDAEAASYVVVVCDPLFDEVVGAPCGGPAEDAWRLTPGLPALTLVDRFDAGSRRILSVYATAAARATTSAPASGMGSAAALVTDTAAP